MTTPAAVEFRREVPVLPSTTVGSSTRVPVVVSRNTVSSPVFWAVTAALLVVVVACLALLIYLCVSVANDTDDSLSVARSTNAAAGLTGNSALPSIANGNNSQLQPAKRGKLQQALHDILPWNTRKNRDFPGLSTHSHRGVCCTGRHRNRPPGPNHKNNNRDPCKDKVTEQEYCNCVCNPNKQDLDPAFQVAEVVAMNQVLQILYYQMIWGDNIVTRATGGDDPVFEVNFLYIVQSFAEDFFLDDARREIRTVAEFRAKLVEENASSSFQKRFISDPIILDYQPVTSNGFPQITLHVLETFYLQSRIDGSWQNVLQNLTITYVKGVPSALTPEEVQELIQRGINVPVPLDSYGWLTKLIVVHPLTTIPYGTVLPTSSSAPPAS